MQGTPASYQPTEGTFVTKTISSELRRAGDAQLEEVVKFADPMVLRGLVYQLTGDEAIAATRTVPGLFSFMPVNLLADPSEVELIQRRAAELLKAFRDQDGDEVDVGSRERLRRSLALAAGTEPDPAEVEMWEEHTALDPSARSSRWTTTPPPAAKDQFEVVVVGAGIAGLAAAVQLERLGLPFTVFEKNADVAGTWYENRYPGARVDSPSRLYTHSYGVDYDWPSLFAVQADNERYLNWVADHFDVRKHIEFESRVTAMTWLDAENAWEVRVSGRDGDRVVRANAVLTAVGLLNTPSVPEFEGLEDFAGEVFHTARWPEDLDLRGKRVAVVGTGCTGYQLIPAMAGDAERILLFQRTPSWIFPVDGYLSDSPPQARWLDRNFPYFTNFSRFALAHLFGPDCFGNAFNVDPDYEDEIALSEGNRKLYDERVAYLQATLADRPDLLAQMTPVAPPLSTRPVLCDTDDNVLHALLRGDAELIASGVSRLTEHGLETTDGRAFDVDVIVLATGFRADAFTWPMELRGRGGKAVDELWERDGPRAYLGTMLPGFPNLFMLYGPNTSPYSGGTPADYAEYVTRFALSCMVGLIESGRRSVDVSDDAYARFAEVNDRAQSRKAYMDARSNTYMKNRHGRSPSNAAIDVRRMWGWLRSPTGPRPGAPEVYSAGDDESASELRPYFGEDLTVA
jgi:4-hydroxyacetophenone monooxygenase